MDCPGTSARLDAIFAARGWLAEHPPAFRALLLRESVPIEARPGSAVFRLGDKSNGPYGLVSGAIGVAGGHRRQSPLLGHVMRAGEWFGVKALLHGGPRNSPTGRSSRAASCSSPAPGLCR